MATRIQKKTAQRMIDKLNGELDNLFEHQEMGKGGRVAKKCCNGGRLRRRMPLGGDLLGATQMLQPLSANAPRFNPLQADINSLAGNVNQGMRQSQPLPFYNYAPTGTGSNLTFGSRVNKFLNNPWWGKIGQGLGTIASYAPAAYNLFKGMGPTEQISYGDYRNPEYNKAVDLMSNRRYDPTAELRAVEEADASYRQGLRNIGSQSSGALSNRLASAAVRRLRGRSDVLSKAQNINLGLQGEEAQFRAGLGAQDVGTRFAVEDINARNRAARRNYLSEAMTNIQQIALQNRLMRNQQQRDDRLFNLAQNMSPMYGFNPDYSMYFRQSIG